jgi:hypothetical protein
MVGQDGGGLRRIILPSLLATADELQSCDVDRDLASFVATTAIGLVQCGVTIDARSGTSDPDNCCPATKPKLT